MKFLPLVWAALWRRKLRTVLTLLSVVTAFALFGTMMGLNAAFQHFVDLASRTEIYVSPRFTGYVTDEMAQQLARLPNVVRVARGGWLQGYYRTPKTQMYVLMADSAAPQAWPDLPLTPAQWVTLAKAPDSVYLSRISAKRWKLATGDNFAITSNVPRADGAKVWYFKVLDVLPDAPNWTGGFSVGNYRYFQNSRPRAVQAQPFWFRAVAKEGADADATAEAIDKAFANSAIPTISESDVSGARTRAEGTVNVAAVTRRVGAVGLFMILLLVGHGVSQSVRERLPEFAMLKTLGFSDGGVMALVIGEALVPCLIGAALGLGLAAAFAGTLPRLLPDLGLPEPYISFRVVAEAFAAAFLVALLGAALPARRLKRLDVAAVLSGR